MKFLFIDLETTGLSAKTHQLIEVAYILTDEKFNIELTGNHLLDCDSSCLLFSVYAAKMHEKLMSEVGTSKQPYAKWVHETDKAIASALPEDEDIWIAGNSVASLDIPFMRQFLPLTKSMCSHRSFDVRTVIKTCELAGIELNPNFGSHRAMPDAEESLRLAKKGIERLKGK